MGIRHHHCTFTILFQSACKPAERKEPPLGYIRQLTWENGMIQLHTAVVSVPTGMLCPVLPQIVLA